MTERNTSDQFWYNNLDEYSKSIISEDIPSVNCNNLTVPVNSNFTGLNTTFTTTGGTPAQLNYNEIFIQAANWIGPFSTIQNITLQRTGNIVTLTGVGFQAAASVTATLTVAGFLPTRFRPASNLVFLIYGLDASTQLSLRFTIGSNGDLIIARNDGTAFVNGSGTCGPLTWGISYLV